MAPMFAADNVVNPPLILRNDKLVSVRDSMKSSIGIQRVNPPTLHAGNEHVSQFAILSICDLQISLE
jgi:hypothetical protein